MEKIYRLWLTAVAKIYRASMSKLLDLYGSAEAVYNLSPEEIEKISFLSKAEKAAVSAKEIELAKSYLKHIEENNIRFLTPLDDDYPVSLFSIEDPPQGLFCRGNFIDFNDNVMIGVVGARKCTQYGYNAAKTISKNIAKEGAVIVSGMALGIDSAAHEGALEAKMPTVAVFGCGVNVAYPASNHMLMKRIMETGMVISEYPVNTPASKFTFPERNRIISGISCGLAVIEASVKSGSLITARCAAEQGKDLYAVPGNINSAASEGTNELIKDGAHLITSADDVVFNYAHALEKAKKKYHLSDDEYLPAEADNNDIEAAICEVLSSESLSIDRISALTGYEPADVSTTLLMMELGGKIIANPDSTYSKGISEKQR